MKVKKQKYRRLQVENIALRTFFEIAVLILAIVISCITVINSYENSYERSTTDTAQFSAAQLAHNISAIADVDAVEMENAERRDYAKEFFSQQLEKSFIGEDVQYSGAIFSVDDSGAKLFAASSVYNRLYANTNDLPEVIEALSAACAGERVVINIDDTYIAFEPLTDPDTGKIYAISSAALDFRSSTEFDSPVKSRLVLISVVSGVLILAYFTISSAISERRKISGEAV